MDVAPFSSLSGVAASLLPAAAANTAMSFSPSSALYNPGVTSSVGLPQPLGPVMAVPDTYLAQPMTEAPIANTTGIITMDPKGKVTFKEDTRGIVDINTVLWWLKKNNTTAIDEIIKKQDELLTGVISTTGPGSTAPPPPPPPPGSPPPPEQIITVTDADGINIPISGFQRLNITTNTTDITINPAIPEFPVWGKITPVFSEKPDLDKTQGKSITSSKISTSAGIVYSKIPHTERFYRILGWTVSVIDAKKVKQRVAEHGESPYINSKYGVDQYMGDKLEQWSTVYIRNEGDMSTLLKYIQENKGGFYTNQATSTVTPYVQWVPNQESPKGGSNKYGVSRKRKIITRKYKNRKLSYKRNNKKRTTKNRRRYSRRK